MAFGKGLGNIEEERRKNAEEEEEGLGGTLIRGRPGVFVLFGDKYSEEYPYCGAKKLA